MCQKNFSKTKREFTQAHSSIDELWHQVFVALYLKVHGLPQWGWNWPFLKSYNPLMALEIVLLWFWFSRCCFIGRGESLQFFKKNCCNIKTQNKQLSNYQCLLHLASNSSVFLNQVVQVPPVVPEVNEWGLTVFNSIHTRLHQTLVYKYGSLHWNIFGFAAMIQLESWVPGICRFAFFFLCNWKRRIRGTSRNVFHICSRVNLLNHVWKLHTCFKQSLSESSKSDRVQTTTLACL